MRRSIEAPDHVYSTIEQAARWLGFSVKQFRALVSAHPDLLPPIRIGRSRSYYWHWEDLVAFARWQSRQPPAVLAKEGPEDDEV